MTENKKDISSWDVRQILAKKLNNAIENTTGDNNVASIRILNIIDFIEKYDKENNLK